jgi:hypothetical protein
MEAAASGSLPGKHQKKEMTQALDPHHARVPDGISGPDHRCQGIFSFGFLSGFFRGG